MFFFLVFHTKISASNDIEKKLITTLVYGTVLYVLFHVLLNTSQKPFFVVMRQYFWLMLLVDVIAVLVICRSLLTKMSDQTRGSLSGVGKRIVSFLEGMIDTGIYSDTVDFDSQSDDVITDLEAVKRRAGILKQQQNQQSHTQNRNEQDGRTVTFATNGNDSHNINPEDVGGTQVSAEELQQVEDLINTLSNSIEANNSLEQHAPVHKPNSLGSTPINALRDLPDTNRTENNRNNDDNRRHPSEYREGELPPELQPVYTVPKNAGNGRDGMRVLRNPLQPDLQPSSVVPLPPPQCVTPDSSTTDIMKRATTYNPNVWDDPSPFADLPSQSKQPPQHNSSGNSGDRDNSRNGSGGKNNSAPPVPDFSKPLPVDSVYTGNLSQLSDIMPDRQPSDESSNRNSGSKSGDNSDTRSEVSEFDLDLGDFEDSL